MAGASHKNKKVELMSHFLCLLLCLLYDFIFFFIFFPFYYIVFALQK